MYDYFTIFENASNNHIRAILFERELQDDGSYFKSVYNIFELPGSDEKVVEDMFKLIFSCHEFLNFETLNTTDAKTQLPYDTANLKHRSKNPIKRLSRAIASKLAELKEKDIE